MLLAAALAIATLAACGDTEAQDDGGLHGEITVLAASSLSDAFTDLEAQFEAAHPNATITLSFGATSELVSQIVEGAPADVFASADVASMDRVVEARAATGEPTDLVRNQLTIAVEPGNPLDISDVRDLTARATTVVLCASEVPCGRLADQILSRAGVVVTPASREANVRAALAKVELGEADAALVYATDVRSSGQVDGVSIAEADNAVTTLQIVALDRSAHGDLAQAWVDFIASHTGDLVEEYGFLPL